MGIGQAFKAYWKNFSTLDGCAPRSEVWWNVLITIIISFIPIIGTIYDVVSIIPSITLAVRRMHDINMSGWWYWLFIWFVFPFIIISLIPSRPSKYNDTNNHKSNHININQATKEE